MRLFRAIWQTLKAAVLVLAAWAALGQVGLAMADKLPEPAKSSADYTLAYALMLLGAGLGLLCVLKSSNRTDQAGPHQYVPKATLKED